jgi:hypothetical protein
MSEATLRVTANTQEAEQALQNLRKETADTAKEFKGLDKELGRGAGKSLGQVEQSLGGVAGALGLSSQQTRVLTQSFKTATSAASTATVALGGIGVALAAVSAIVVATKNHYEELSRAAIAAMEAQTRYILQLSDAQHRAHQLLMSTASAEEQLLLRRNEIERLGGELRLENARDTDALRAQAINLAARETSAIENIHRMEQELLNARGAQARQLERNIAREQETLRLNRERQRQVGQLLVLLREENDLMERGWEIMHAYRDLLFGLNRTMEDNNNIRQRGIRLRLEEVDATDQLLLKIKEENELIAELNRLKRESQNEAVAEEKAAEDAMLEEKAESRLSWMLEMGNREAELKEQQLQEELDRELELATKRKDELERIERESAERRAAIQKSLQQEVDSFTTSSLRSMVGVYAGASKEQAKARRQALGDGLMAEGLSNVISAPVRFWTQGPQAAAISASTGAAQVAFGKALGGTLGHRGSGGGGESPSTNAPSEAQQTNITETNNVTNNILVGDPREWNRDSRRANRQGERLGMRGL